MADHEEDLVDRDLIETLEASATPQKLTPSKPTGSKHTKAVSISETRPSHKSPGSTMFSTTGFGGGYSSGHKAKTASQDLRGALTKKVEVNQSAKDIRGSLTKKTETNMSAKEVRKPKGK